MKIGIVLPHLGSDATSDNILRVAVDAEKQVSTLFGLQSDFFGH